MDIYEIEEKELPPWMKDGLNDSQLNAIAACLARDNHITLIKGPPGTGKTTTIVRLINAALLSVGFLKNKRRPKILVCAPSNAAIDEVVKRCHKNIKTKTGDQLLRAEMVRIGSGVTKDTVAWEIHLDRILDPQYELNQLRKRLRKIEADKHETKQKWEKLSSSMKRNAGGSEQDKAEKKRLGEKLRKIRLKQVEVEQQLAKEEKSNLENTDNATSKKDKMNIMRERDIIFSTLSASASTYLNTIEFDLLIIDESTQSYELSSLIPFQLNVASIVLVGDEKQLPATVISRSCEEYGFSKSFFERCIDNKIEPYLLQIQYRMHPAIREWPSNMFYKGLLQDGPNITKEVIPFVEKHKGDPRLGPYTFFDVYHEPETEIGKSYCNKGEADFILRLVDYMSCNARFYPYKHQWNGNVGIVTPYRGQVNYLRKCLRDHRNKKLQSVVVDTVESFQGQEKDVIIFSCVRSQRDEKHKVVMKNVGFLTDLRRLNVALTRAKYCCVIVGNSNTLRVDATWMALIRDAHVRGCAYRVPDFRHRGPKETLHKDYLARDSSHFLCSKDEENMRKKQSKNANENENERARPMDVDDNQSSSVSASKSASSSSSRKSSMSISGDRSVDGERNKQHHYHRHQQRDANRKKSHNHYRDKKKRKLTDTEIAKILHLPEPPTDPRKRRR
mmetsp:Transcript_35245/g.56547  ORF Transcript_35245/g.56547 Transcript_35245/m.56547 type:complete len:673 (+) Transcript_35245:2-2020(+)